jgi:polyisoprenoid-binding protein YceI
VIARVLRWLLGVALVSLALTAPAQASQWKVEYAKSDLVFITKQMNVPVDGMFRHFQVALQFDPARPETSRAQIEIDMNSITTGIEDADEEAKTATWLDVATYPTASFVSTSVNHVEADRYTATGALTIKGTTKTATLPFAIKPLPGGALQLAGEYTMKRLDFNIGGGVWGDTSIVADEVKLRYKLLLLP